MRNEIFSSFTTEKEEPGCRQSEYRPAEERPRAGPDDLGAGCSAQPAAWGWDSSHQEICVPPDSYRDSPRQVYIGEVQAACVQH